MSNATKFVAPGTLEPPVPVINIDEHQKDLAKRQAEHEAKRKELRKCLNFAYAAKVEVAKPVFRWTVKARWGDTNKPGQDRESEQEVVAQNENDAWAAFCDRIGEWPNRRYCDLLSITKGKQVSAEDVAAQILNVDDEGAFPVEWIGATQKVGEAITICPAGRLRVVFLPRAGLAGRFKEQNVSETIRKAIIELELRMKKGGKAAIPNYDEFVKANQRYEASINQQTKAEKENQRAVKESGHVHEEFGRKSALAFAHAGHGVLQFGRGLALLGASSEEESRKLIENLVKIEAGVSILKGGAGLAKFAGEFGKLGIAVGGLTGVVAAGAVAWHQYHAIQERVAEQQRKMADDADKIRSREDRLRETLTGIAAGGSAARTDAALRPEERERRRQAELREIERRLREQSGRFGELDAAAIGARGRMGSAEQRQAAAMLRGTKAEWNPFALPGQPGREYAEAAKQKEEAEQARRTYRELRQEQLGIGTQRGADLSRRLDIERGRRDDQLSQLEREQAGAMSGAVRRTSQQEAMINFGGDPHGVLERQDQVDAANKVYAQTARLFGAPLYTEKEVGEAYSGKVNEVNKAFEKAFTDMQSMIQTVNERNAALRAELEAGAAANQ